LSAVTQDTAVEPSIKKVDAILYGNVATEAVTVLINHNPEFAVVAPAFSAHNRTTISGYHIIDGDLLGTGADYDSESPAATTNTMKLFSGTA
jgi:uncharacterized protein YgbK (DUF1537 family)